MRAHRSAARLEKNTISSSEQQVKGSSCAKLPMAPSVKTSVTRKRTTGGSPRQAHERAIPKTDKTERKMADPTATPKLKVLVFAASLRAESQNRKLPAIAARVARQAGAWVAPADMRDFEVPLYDGDVEAAEGIPAGERELQRGLVASDAFIVSSPEYNASM